MDNDTKDICRYIIEHKDISVAHSLKYGTSPNAVSPCGLRLLEVALGVGNVVIVKLLLDAGADVNVMSGDGDIEILADVMDEANFDNDTRRLKLLLDAGLSPDSNYLTQMSTLLTSACSSSLKVVKLLIQYGAAINIQDEDGWTPLMFACEMDRSHCPAEESIAIAEYLLQNGADVSAKSNDGVSVREIVQIQNYDPAARDRLLAIIDRAIDQQTERADRVTGNE